MSTYIAHATHTLEMIPYTYSDDPYALVVAEEEVLAFIGLSRSINRNILNNGIISRKLSAYPAMPSETTRKDICSSCD
jgi:hypothetical protein